MDIHIHWTIMKCWQFPNPRQKQDEARVPGTRTTPPPTVVLSVLTTWELYCFFYPFVKTYKGTSKLLIIEPLMAQIKKLWLVNSPLTGNAESISMSWRCQVSPWFSGTHTYHSCILLFRLRISIQNTDSTLPTGSALIVAVTISLA